MINVKLFIAVSSARDWKVHFASSILGLVYRLGKQGVGEGFNLESFTIKTIGNASCLSMSREANLREAFDKGYTHILMLDDDMIFPDDTVERILAHKKPFIACNYMKKGNGEPTAQGMDGKWLDSSTRTGIESVYSVGMGVVLIELDAIRHVGAPHFAVMWDETRKTYWGEDLYFCELVRGSAPAVEVWVDHDVSRLTGHVGDCGYCFDSHPALKKEEAA